MDHCKALYILLALKNGALRGSFSNLVWDRILFRFLQMQFKRKRNNPNRMLGI